MYQRVKKSARKALFGGLAGLTLAGCGNGLNNHLGRQLDIQAKENIQSGELKYSNGKELRSEGFAICSALILDYGNSAVMTHAIEVNDNQNGDDLIDVDRVVEISARKLEDEGINPIESEAIVDAGSKSSYDKILTELNRRGIKVRSASYVLEGSPRVRDISYNPVTNKLIVRKTGSSQ